MSARRLLAALLGVSWAAAASLAVPPSAGAVDPGWNGRYQIITYASNKMGTSAAAAQ